MDAPRRAIGAGDAALIFAPSVLALFAAGALLHPVDPILGLAGGDLAILAVVAFIARARGIPAAALGLRRPPWRAALPAAAGAAAMALAAAHLAGIQDGVFRALGKDYGPDLKRLEELLLPALRDHPLLALFTITLLAPLTEEILFRGVLMRGLATSWGPRRALLLSALLFGLIHAVVPKIGLMFLVGLYFGAIVMRSGSTWAGVLAHGVNNGIAVFLGVLPRFNPWVLLAAGTAAVVALRMVPAASRPADDAA